jgi:putative redox protein
MSEQTRSTTNGSGAAGPREVLVYGDAKGFTQEIIAGPHQLTADEPKGVGGNDEGPTPYDLLLAALGSCTSITVTMYAQRNGWPLQGVRTWLRHSRIHAQDCAECETKEGKLDHIEIEIRLEGPLLSEEQRTKLLEIAEKCPVHRTLVTENVISTRAT